MKSSYNVVIIDDHPIVVQGLKTFLDSIEFVNVLTTFNDGMSIFNYPDLKIVDIIFLDVFLNDSNGIDICIKLRKEYPNLIILAISSQSERSIISQMMNSGANGYLLKSASIAEFKNCIIESLEGQKTYCLQVGEIVAKIPNTDITNMPRPTAREKDILKLLSEGKSTQDISDELFLSFLTVQTHRRNLLNKYQVKNVVELLKFVKLHGLL